MSRSTAHDARPPARPTANGPARPTAPSVRTPSRGGSVHWLDLFDSFVANLTLFVVGALECIGIGWIYGADRFAADTLAMTNRRIPVVVLWLYKVFATRRRESRPTPPHA